VFAHAKIKGGDPELHTLMLAIDTLREAQKAKSVTT
jgi:hypothetical protein